MSKVPRPGSGIPNPFQSRRSVGQQSSPGALPKPATTSREVDPEQAAVLADAIAIASQRSSSTSSSTSNTGNATTPLSIKRNSGPTPMASKSKSSRSLMSHTPQSPSISKSKQSTATSSAKNSPANSRAVSPTRAPGEFRVGDRVTIDGVAIPGTLRYLGALPIKPGNWAGVELDEVGKGKNDGSVNGVHYFQCPPNTGLFAPPTKLTLIQQKTPPQSDSSNNHPTPIPSMTTPTPKSKPSRAPSSSAHHAALAAARISAGSRASKYIGVTADQLKKRVVAPPLPVTTIASRPVVPGMMSPTSKIGGIPRSGSPAAPGRPSPRNSVGSNSSSTSASAAPPTFGLRMPGQSGTTSPRPTATNPSTGTPRKDKAGRRTSTSSSASGGAESLTRQHSTSSRGTSVSTSAATSAIPLLSAEELHEEESLQQKMDRLLMGTPGGLDYVRLQERVEVLESENGLLQRDIEERSAELDTIRQRAEKERESWLVERGELVVGLKDIFIAKAELERKLEEQSMELAETTARRAQGMDDSDSGLSSGGGASMVDVDVVAKVRKEMERSFEQERRDLKERVAKLQEEKEAARQKATHLEVLTEDLKKAATESIEMAEKSEKIAVELELAQRNFTAERKKTKDLQAQCAEFQGAAAEAIEAYEATATRLEETREESKEKDDIIAGLRADMDNIQKEVQDVISASQNAESEKEIEKIRSMFEIDKKRLEVRVEELTRSVELGEKVKEERDRLREEMKELDRIKNERTRLEDRVAGLQKDIEEEEKAKDLIATDLKALKEEKKKIETESRKVIDAKEKLAQELQHKIEMLEEQLGTVKNEQQARINNIDTNAGSESSTTADQVRAQLEEQMERAKVGYESEIKSLREVMDRGLRKRDELEARITELESVAVSGDGSGRSTAELLGQISNLEEQIVSLQHKIDNLTKENATFNADYKELKNEHDKLTETHKQVEAECLKLMDEVERLHAEGLEQLDGSGASLVAAIVAADAEGVTAEPGSTPASPEVARLQKLLAEKQAQLEKLKVQHGAEIRELKQKLSDLERNKQREVNALNKDVAELESLVESKIFHEADLEEALEVERKSTKKLRDEITDLKDQIRAYSSSAERSGASSSAVFGSVSERHRTRDSGILSLPNGKPNGVRSSPTSGLRNSVADDDRQYCEICEEYGHDIISCQAVFGQSKPKVNGTSTEKEPDTPKDEVDKRPYCENCEEYGLHTTETCPNQDETF